jgi:hypothetical protein
MIGFACDVAATTARTRVPALIAESLATASAATATATAPTSTGAQEASSS